MSLARESFEVEKSENGRSAAFSVTASGGAAAAFKVPAATGHAVHIRDSPLILKYAQTPASARHRQAWLLAYSASREQPAFGPLPRFKAELISLLPPLRATCCFPSILVQASASQLGFYELEKTCMLSTGQAPRRRLKPLFFHPHGRPSSRGK